MAMNPRVRQTLRGCLLASSIFIACASAQAPVDLRVALVIGNSAYSDAPLANPTNDAQAMEEALSKLGFTVRVVRDADKAAMVSAFEVLLDKLKGQRGVVMVYYAGHGVQVDYDNYLVPVDARIRQESDIALQGFNISKAIESLAASGSRLSIVVLDACRDNPFKTRLAIAGLAPRDAPKGVFVAYATEPGNVAIDGDAATGNGLYTQFLLREMRRPATTIDDVFKRVRFAVRRASDGRQIPSYANGLDDAYSFERGFNVKPQNEQARAAQFAEQKAHWDRIRASKNPDEFFTFIDTYPDSSIGELAQAQLERLARRQIVAQAGPQEAEQHPADNRFRKGDIYRMRMISDQGPPSIFTVEVNEVVGDTARYTNVFGNGQSGESTIAGAVIKDGISTYDPPYVLIPGGEFQVGKRWSGRSMRTFNTGDKQWMDYAARVVGREKVTVPAGTFDAYKVEYQFQMQSGVLLKSTYWAQPEWGLSIKVTFQYQDRAGIVRTVTRELLDRTRGS
jgi:uncharacterized caspase-like protein